MSRLSRLSRLPVVLVTSCNKPLGEHPFHVAGRKYVDAVRLAGALPLIAPPFAEGELDAMLAVADGVLFTGSQSNVHPGHFGEVLHDATLPLDADRDAWTLPLVRRVLDSGLPLFGICRGAQEVNVALGGSLHQAVQQQPGLADHRGAGADATQGAEQVYGPSHPVEVLPGGVLASVLASVLAPGLASVPDRPRFDVNSVHGQGIKRLAAGLRVEAVAPDGLVEAFSMPAAPAFNLCVQWHPEWQAASNPVSVQLFHAFGAALRLRVQQAATSS